MMNSIDDINVTSYGIHVLLLSIFHLVVKVGGVRGGGEQLQHEHEHLRPRTLQSGQSTSQKIFYIHQQSTNASFHHPHISEFLWNIAMSGSGTFSTSRYFDVVATSIVVISDLDFRFSGIEFLIFNCVARRHA